MQMGLKSLLSSVAFVMLSLLALGIAGCGGGGGEGGGGSSTGGKEFSLSPASISFTGTQGGTTPAAQRITISATGGTIYFKVVAGSRVSVSTPSCTGSQCTFWIYPDNPSSFSSAGTFLSTVEVQGCVDPFCNSPIFGTPNKTVQISYTVIAAPALTLSKASVDFEIKDSDITIPPATVVLGTTVATGSWSGSISYLTGPTTGWLSLNAASGSNYPSNVVLSASPVPAGTYTANVTFTSGSLTKTLPVKLIVRKTGPTSLVPGIITAGVATEVVIRGLGFSALGTPQVLFGTSSASSVTRVSDTELRATVPATLGQGSHLITVKDAFTTLPSSGVQIQAIAPRVYAASSFALASNTSPSWFSMAELHFDAAQQRLIRYSSSDEVLETYQYNSTTSTWLPAYRTLSGKGSVLAFDGSEVYVSATSPSSRILRVNASTLATVETEFPVGTGTISNVALSNDQNLIGTFEGNFSTELFRYDLTTKQTVVITSYANGEYAPAAGSADGRYVFFNGAFTYVDTSLMKAMRYDASTGTVSIFSAPTLRNGRLTVARDGSRVIESVNLKASNVYDSSFVLQGTLPAHMGIALSPDARRAYILKPSGTGASGSFPSSICSYDLTAKDANNDFLLIGSCQSLFAYEASIGGSGFMVRSMTVSSDGSTLFISADQKVLVVPL